MTGNKSKEINILIVDDHSSSRKGVIYYLSNYTEIRKFDEAGNGIEAIEKMNSEKYDIVFLDIQMPKMNGLETARMIKSDYKESKIIIITMVDHSKDIIQLLELGVDGFILKDEEEIIKAYESVRDGNLHLSPSVYQIWSNHLIQVKRNKRLDTDKQKLSRREEEVLLLYSNENSTKEIADKLFISPLTVKNHFENIKKKLNVKTKVGALLKAIRTGVFQSLDF